MNIIAVLVIALLCASFQPALSEDLSGKPKLGPDIVPVFQSTEFLRSRPAPDYWLLTAFYVPQETDASCSVASITMLVNALRGLPEGASDGLVTQDTLLTKVANTRWRAAVQEEGTGVSWAELENYTLQSLHAYGIDASVEVWRPLDGSEASLAKLRSILAANEESADDIVVAAFNQGVLTGDEDADHVSPIGAYDRERDRVLIMDVDREWYVPYWTSVTKLMEAMLKPDRDDLEGGGLMSVRKRK